MEDLAEDLVAVDLAVVALEDNNYPKLSFSIATKTYIGIIIMLLLIFTFIFIICSILILDILLPNFPGTGTGTFGGTLVPFLILIFFTVIIWTSIKSINKEWPICQNHNERLVVVNKENLDNFVLISFECPQKDTKIKMLALKSSPRHHSHSKMKLRTSGMGTGR
ncbi:MAG: hypothetical protein PHU12_04550 [Candidatus Aenigmarchaeota archaeon]|nr:hypothetical protein [Candidatus Aenigmarchaeota archaeon]